MEARKRGTTRDSMDGHDSESGTAPYSSMGSEMVRRDNDADGIMVVQAEDSHLRSLAKGLTWRFVASGTTIVIAKIVTGETKVAFQIGFLEFFAKIGIYYLHERIWAKIKI
mmetsp:Transcript_16597/g.38331  ORF Transcript_16597/g.38331 Transcript_16597/m.38331 type:complete len:111 (+) Transcript_16597:243-575(+)